MDPLLQILKKLNDHGVDFVLIGGMAAIAHGSPVVTQDVDVCVSFDRENRIKIQEALRDIHPRVRMRPDKMPLPDISKLESLRNLNLLTDLGVIDLLGEVPEVGDYHAIKGRTIEIDIGGLRCKVLDLETLIESKRAAGREKDKLGVFHLEAIRKARHQSPNNDKA
jgi:predicted nucleotidyltransferase